MAGPGVGRVMDEKSTPVAVKWWSTDLTDLIDLRLPVLLPKLSAQRLRPALGLELGVRGACDFCSEVGVANG